MIIYGAGLAGLLAGCLFQTVSIHEAAPQRSISHKALLRFRTRAVGDAVGIEFRSVCVRKGVWAGNGFRAPDIQLANFYAKKVIGALQDRSIWNLEPVERWIAPENFIEQLIDRCNTRLYWSTPLAALPDRTSEPCISTIPMNVMAGMVCPTGIPYTCQFTYQPIVVKRWRVKGADVYQTVYFPDPATTLYRVSITGDLVIAEYMKEADHFYFWNAFGVNPEDAEPLETTTQRFGKIAPINETWRRQFIYDLTTRYNVYSLGRFATWRNILLDDVLKDIAVIKRLINSNAYERRLA